MEGIRIGDYHTWNDWEMYLKHVYISFPPPKTNRVSVPGADGTIDLSESLTGEVYYNNRNISAEMVFADGGYAGMNNMGSIVAEAVHGKRLRIIFDDDPGFAYIGRCSIDLMKENEMITGFTFTAVADPYKYECNVGDDWLWDDFDFENGIIREYDNLTVSGSYKLLIPGRMKKIIPIITATSKMAVEYEGKRYDLYPGINKLYGLLLSSGDNILTFTGNGTVSVDYKGGML